MARVVPDASALAVALIDDGRAGQQVRDRLRGNYLAAPELVDLEVVAVVRKRVLSAGLHPDRAAQAIEDLASLPLTRVAHRHLLGRVWELHQNVTPYDAAYVAVAKQLDAILVTADQRLSTAPQVRCAIEVLSP